MTRNAATAFPGIDQRPSIAAHVHAKDRMGPAVQHIVSYGLPFVGRAGGLRERAVRNESERSPMPSLRPDDRQGSEHHCQRLESRGLSTTCARHPRRSSRSIAAPPPDRPLTIAGSWPPGHEEARADRSNADEPKPGEAGAEHETG
jgi:hypothetical protein